MSTGGWWDTPLPYMISSSVVVARWPLAGEWQVALCLFHGKSPTTPLGVLVGPPGSHRSLKNSPTAAASNQLQLPGATEALVLRNRTVEETQPWIPRWQISLSVRFRQPLPL